MTAPHPTDLHREIARLTAERDALQVRLEKSLDVRGNLIAWNEAAQARITTLEAALAGIERRLPPGDTLRRIRPALRAPTPGKRGAQTPGRDARAALNELCRAVAHIRRLVSAAAAAASYRGSGRPRPAKRARRARR